MGRKKISGDYGWVMPTVVGVAVLGIGYLIAQKLGLFTQSGGSANNSGTTAANSSAAAASTAADQASGAKVTLSPNEIANIANQVYGAGTTATQLSDLFTMTNQLTQVNNAADLNAVIAAFGTKQMPANSFSAWSGTCMSLGISCTAVGLGDYVRVVYQYVDPTGQALSDLNSYFSSQGINYTF